MASFGAQFHGSACFCGLGEVPTAAGGTERLVAMVVQVKPRGGWLALVLLWPHDVRDARMWVESPIYFTERHAYADLFDFLRVVAGVVWPPW